MRIWLSGLVLAAGCGRQLNPDYCADHATDNDCISAGYVYVDAAAPCSTDVECVEPGKNVCDVVAHTCVVCTPTDHPSCINDTKVCSSSDVCVGCVQNTDCDASGICLTSSGTCAAPDSILHVSPDGSPTAPCSDAMKCSLDHAVAIADAGHHVIQLETGSYNLTATITLGFEGLHLVPTPGAAPKISAPNTTVFSVTASVEIDNVEISGSNSTTIKCSGGGNQPILVLEQVNIHGSGNDAIDLDQCTLTLERSKVYSNQRAAVNANDSSVAIRNCFFYANGNTFSRAGAVQFNGDTDGRLEFNTFAYNQGYDQLVYDFIHQKFVPDQDGGGLNCMQQPSSSRQVTVNGNLFVENKPFTYVITSSFGQPSCTGNFTTNNLIGTASDAAFVNTSDQHLTAMTPAGNGKVRDDPSSNCSNVGQDFDGDTRPLNGACDYGADEFKAP